MQSTLAPQAGRLDRHVRRSCLRLSEGVSHYRAAYSLEEGLRLANLPGEDEGRVYCFRSVLLGEVPPDASRRVWTERVQHALSALAAQAVHGRDPNAAAARAVYFNNLEEVLETLLRNALRALSEAAWAKPQWFSALLLDVAAETSYQQQIPAILDRLRPPAMAPGAAAAVLFAALGDRDPSPLLASVPAERMRSWIREFEGKEDAAAERRPVQLPETLKASVLRAASHFGWRDVSTVWFASQAVLCVSPGAWAAGMAVKRARSMLRVMEDAHQHESPHREAIKSRSREQRTLVFHDLERSSDRIPEAAPPNQLFQRAAPEGPASNPRSVGSHGEDERDAAQRAEAESATIFLARPRDPGLPSLQSVAGLASVSGLGADPQSMPRGVGPDSSPAADELPASLCLLGEETAAGGLFFLLNVLTRIGLPAALEACSALAEGGLVAHILKAIAARAGVADSDPVVLCLDPAETQFELSPEVLADLSRRPEAWPVGFAPTSRLCMEANDLLRVWMVAVRRWCWRMGRLTLREIVHRKGRVWLTRTDVDITLPLDQADVRIRRIGLDIDPGWLPWFGDCGRVVRFHYRQWDART